MQETIFSKSLAKMKIQFSKMKKYYITSFVIIALILAIGHFTKKLPLAIFAALCFGASVPGFVSYIYKPEVVDEERRYTRSTEGEYGTACKMTKEEAEETFDIGNYSEILGNILGRDEHVRDKLFSHRMTYGINGNVLIIGAPGSGKSRCFAIPMIMQMIRRGESIIITDPKGELYNYTSLMAKAHGYTVKIINFNPKFMLHSDSCAYMSVIGDDDLMAMSFAETIIRNSTNELKEDFWDKQEKGFLTAELLKISNDPTLTTPEQKSLATVYKDIVEHTVDELVETFESPRMNWDHPAKGFGMNFNTSDSQVQGNVKGGLATRLGTLNNKLVQKVTSYPDIDFTLPGREKCIYYVACSDQDKTMQFYMALFFSLLYQELVNFADMQENGKLPIVVNMMLDEFRNIGKIGEFPQKLATVRGRGINTQIIIQDLGQLQIMYPENEWESIINCCSLMVCLATNSQLTADYLSKRSGIETIVDESLSFPSGALDVARTHMNCRVMEKKGKRTSLNMDEICRLKYDDVLIVPSGHNAIVLKKVDFSEHPMCKEMKKCNSKYHMPLWVRDIIERGDEAEMARYKLNSNVVRFRNEDCSDIELCTEDDFLSCWTKEKQNALDKKRGERARGYINSEDMYDESKLKKIFATADELEKTA